MDAEARGCAAIHANSPSHFACEGLSCCEGGTKGIPSAATHKKLAAQRRHYVRVYKGIAAAGVRGGATARVSR